ncbi:type IIL restriction-modification enzyme MmeI [Streptomyces sp. NPDC046862]|uniref:Eco57I restriction-modification methylase domain-containing protein n=1 Tax=Streptomyces sp. NPDC046862 TaxID=3154603 RepID=UPI0034521428
MSTTVRTNHGRGRARSGAPLPDGRQQHLDWLSLVDVSGPFLTLPVLLKTWQQLDSIDKPMRRRLRYEHGVWLPDQEAGQEAWIRFLLRELLGWGDALLEGEALAGVLAVEVPEHDERVAPTFALLDPETEGDEDDTAALVAGVSMLGMTLPVGQHPARRIPGSPWSATPIDRMAHLCRHHGVELGLVTDGRWWALVWAPRGGVTTSAVFDTVAWTEQAERVVVRAFVSLLNRRRFFSVEDDEMLLPLLRESLDNQEDVTDALGVQVRQAVELLVEAIGRADISERAKGGRGLADVPAQEVYRGAVAIMMRVVFLLFAEERGLLPSDNELYAQAYSASRLAEELERRARETTEEDLEQTRAGWHRLIALFNAVYEGVDHPKLTMHAYDGSIFDPNAYPWLEGRGSSEDDPREPLPIDDRTVLHMLQSVQHVSIGTGRRRERRKLTFRTLDVEQIGYVYEGLLSYQGRRAEDTIVGLLGKPGLEAEVLLSGLEAKAAGVRDAADLGALLAEEYNKTTGLGSAAKVTKLLAPLGAAEREAARKKLLAATGGDAELTERLLPFYGIIRRDLRDLPVVIRPGALYVTESALRKNTGTHYTPKSLAQKVADGALEPLVYEAEHGPLTTADRSQWRPKSSSELLKLKVADIAMGSAAFLVAACRYLADALVEAWAREKDARAIAYLEAAGSLSASAVDAEADPVMVEARRQVIEHCLYGVDINPMAVEMAKLSLWLVSMDPERPFTFLDDRLVAGDSLLGITSVEQLEAMHLDPVRGRRIHGDGIDFTGGVRRLVREVADERRKLAEIAGTDLEALRRKRVMLTSVREKTRQASAFADLLVGAALAGAMRGDKEKDQLSFDAVKAAHDVADAGENLEVAADELHSAAFLAKQWLAVGQPEGALNREPMHFPLTFPEVWDERGGFDVVVGNPPFLGGTKISGPMGVSYRKYLATQLAGFETDRADLASFFVRRAADISNQNGIVGLVTTHSVTDRASLQVGIGFLVERGWTVYCANPKHPWPSRSASVYIVEFHLANADYRGQRILDGVPVSGITTSFTSATRVNWEPMKLSENLNYGLQGSKPSAKGFIVDGSRREELIHANEKNDRVVRSYLTGSDLNGTPDFSSRRWIINFEDWSEEQASAYAEAFAHVRDRVPGERVGSSEEGNPNWWQFGRPATELYRRIRHLGQVIAFAETSKTLSPVMVSVGPTFGNTVVVLPFSDFGTFGVLASSLHYWWALTHGTAMKNDPRYQVPKCFETFPRPGSLDEVEPLGRRLEEFRRAVMGRRQVGVTGIYNLVHDETCTDPDVTELRVIHKAIDEEVARAYGWHSLLDQPGGLDHGFHDTHQGFRYTIGPVVRQEILDCLLEENQRRYQAEVDAGLHATKQPKKGVPAMVRKTARLKPPAEEPPSLF